MTTPKQWINLIIQWFINLHAFEFLHINLLDEVACSDPITCKRVCDSEVGCSNVALPIMVIDLLPIGKWVISSSSLTDRKYSWFYTTGYMVIGTILVYSGLNPLQVMSFNKGLFNAKQLVLWKLNVCQCTLLPTSIFFSKLQWVYIPASFSIIPVCCSYIQAFEVWWWLRSWPQWWAPWLLAWIPAVPCLLWIYGYISGVNPHRGSSC